MKLRQVCKRWTKPLPGSRSVNVTVNGAIIAKGKNKGGLG